METPIIAAIIVAIVGPIITFFFTRSVGERFLQPMTSRRAAALVGNWEGQVHHEVLRNGEYHSPKIACKFSISGKKILGNGPYISHDGNRDIVTTIVLSGGFLHERFIRFEYNPEATDTVQFGSLILELSNDAKKLTGRFLGHSVRTNGLVYGKLELEKVG